MIVLFDGVSDALEGIRRMIEFTRNLDAELGVPPDGVIVNGDAAIGRDELASFSEHQRVDLKRTGFDAARGGEQFSDRLIQLLCIFR
jgi:hypothetical protein